MNDRLGVAIVTFNSADEIFDCLQSLVRAASEDAVRLDVVVVDNASGDGTADLVEGWQQGTHSPSLSPDLPVSAKPVPKFPDDHSLHVIRSGGNLGYAGGVNLGCAKLMQDQGHDRVWVLNPDAIVPAGTPAAIRRQPNDFGLLGGRVLYAEPADTVQTDGGLLNAWTGVTRGCNNRLNTRDVAFPASSDLDFISGANMIVSRRFWEEIGPMEERYFLYYEEVDWAQRRGDFPLRADESVRIYHHAGASIGSPNTQRAASTLSTYFMQRGRHLFMSRHFPARLPFAWIYTLAKTAQLVLKRDFGSANALFRGALNARPPEAVMSRLSPDAQKRLFGGEWSGEAR